VLKIWKNHPGGEQRISGRGEVTAVVSQQATRVVSRGRRREAAAVTVGAQMRSAVNGRSVAAIQAVRCCETGRGRRAQHAAQRAGTPGAPVTRSSAGSLFNGKPGAAEDANVLELQVQLCTDILVFWNFFFDNLVCWNLQLWQGNESFFMWNSQNYHIQISNQTSMLN